MKQAKRLQKIRQNPRAVTPSQMDAALRDAGFELDHVSGSHHVYRHPDIIETLSIPFRRPHLLPVYVRHALEAIDQLEEQ